MVRITVEALGLHHAAASTTGTRARIGDDAAGVVVCFMFTYGMLTTSYTVLSICGMFTCTVHRAAYSHVA